MIQIAVAFAVGIIFALGLTVSEMINPARVIGFLDVTGRWDPTLLLVMAGALAVTIPGFPLILRRPKPFLATRFSLPTKSRIDPPLILGAAIFGVGWGLAGFCPGPALLAWPRDHRASFYLCLRCCWDNGWHRASKSHSRLLKKTHRLRCAQSPRSNVLIKYASA
jgi:uncharacterized protein